MSDLYAGVDLGGTTVGCALADREGRMVAESSIATDAHQGPEAVLGRIADAIDALTRHVGERPRAIGMGVPGLADIRSGFVRFLPNLPGNWRDVPAGPCLEQRLGVPVRLMNDVRIATLGELTFGHGRSAQTMIFASVGTGIGGGLVIDGRLRLGPLGAAGELGHQTIVPDGLRCGCGNDGCLEVYASGPAIVGEAIRMMFTGQAPLLHEQVQGDASRVTPRAVAEAAWAGDAGAGLVFRRAGIYLGIGLGNLVSALHPDLIVLGGGVAEADRLLLDPVSETIRQRVRMMPTDDLRLERSLLGQRAGVLGGVALAQSSTTIDMTPQWGDE